MAENDLKSTIKVDVKKEFNPEEFRVKFRACLAVLGFVAAVIFLFVAVLSKDAQTSKYTGTILGFLTGTLVTLVFTYYFGSSDQAPAPPPTIKNDIQI